MNMQSSKQIASSHPQVFIDHAIRGHEHNGDPHDNQAQGYKK